MASAGNNAPNRPTSRAFAHKLSKANAEQIRRQAASELKSGVEGVALRTSSRIAAQIGKSNINANTNLFDTEANNEMVEDVSLLPIDYYQQQQQVVAVQQHVQQVLEVPREDLDVKLVPRKIRTTEHILPDEPLSSVAALVQNCIDCYTSDFVVVIRSHLHLSSSVRTVEAVEEARMRASDERRPQQFDIDVEEINEEEALAAANAAALNNTNRRRHGALNEQQEKTPVNDVDSSSSSGSLASVVSLDRLSALLEAMSTPKVLIDSDRSAVSSGSNTLENSTSSATPARSSWATFDLRNSEPDALISGLLSHSFDSDLISSNEKNVRQAELMLLYPIQNETEIIERRLPAEEPRELLNHRILVHCQRLELNLSVEPLFATMALYDARERRKVSENFHFDLNPDNLNRMLLDLAKTEYSSVARSCVFDISKPTQDLFIVVKIEKVLQGDISECAEPYLKEVNSEKVRQQVFDSCHRLGKYRMPLCWTAIWLQNIVRGKNEENSDNDSSASNSLDRLKSNTEQLRRFGTSGGRDSNSLNSRRGSLDKRLSWAGTNVSSNASGRESSATQDDFASQLDNFLPVTLTVSSFFKQEGDKLRDEDMYKFLLDLKKPSTALKRLKCIRGTLKLDISVAPEKLKNALTPELAKLEPFSEEIDVGPTKEILELPTSSSSLLSPNYLFRNLLYICPQSLNFSNRSGERARNIAIKVQFITDINSEKGARVIFGKSSTESFVDEAYTAVTYHNKSPDFYEEIKVKLPSNVSDQCHILFTFYHISIQGQRKGEQQSQTETPVGYAYVPVMHQGSLQTGLFELPVALELPPITTRHQNSESVNLPSNFKWVDGKKPIFSVELIAATTVHPVDIYLDKFLHLTAFLQLGQQQQQQGGGSVNERSMEDDLLKRLSDLPKARLDPLVRFLPLVLDKLCLLMVRPPSVSGHVLNVAQAAFHAMANVVNKIALAPELQSQCDCHGRNSFLASYIHYQAHLPHPDFGIDGHSKLVRPASSILPEDNSSTMSLLNDEEVGSILRKATNSHSLMTPQHLERVSSLKSCIEAQSKTSNFHTATTNSPSIVAKLVHEQLALQWTLCTGTHRETALNCGWFFFELMIKAMIEHLATTMKLGLSNKRLRFSEQFHDDINSLVAAITSDIICRHKTNPLMVERLNCSLAFFMHDLLSVMDRNFVFGLIAAYRKDMASRMGDSNNSSNTLWHLQLDLMRIVCSHEHLISLSLPSSSDLFTANTSSSSPTLSVRSTDSQGSLVSHNTNSSSANSHWAELGNEYRKRHFLLGLSMHLVAKSLDQSSGDVHLKASNLLRTVLLSHELDPRYVSPELRSTVATLYLPLVGLLSDNINKLYSWSTDGQPRLVGTNNNNEHLSLILNVISDNVPNSKGPIMVKEEATRNLLITLLWVLKNVDKTLLRQCWTELPQQRLHTLLELLRMCLSCFQYKGRRSNTRGGKASGGSRKVSKLEEMMSTTGSGVVMRNNEPNLKRRAPASPSMDSSGSQRRWHRGGSSSILRATLSPELSGCNDSSLSLYESDLDGHLATETSMVVLDILLLITQVASNNTMDPSMGLLASVLKVLLHALATTQSTGFLQRLFSVQRAFVFKFPNLLFDDASEHCADLCLRLLKHCSSPIEAVRSQASASLYLLMRQNFEIGNNFARVKMQVTISLSKLVGTHSNFNESDLRKSLKTILVYSQSDEELSSTSFPEQVRDLAFNLHMILSDTVKMKEYTDDVEMHMDLMYRIAKGYQTSPDLRLTWLESMATRQEQNGHYAEAGMCKVHCAALIAEYLHMLEDRSYMPVGAVAFERVSPNALEESAVSDDVVSPDEEGVCAGKNFTEQGLEEVIEQAAKLFNQAGMYESVGEVYKWSLSMAEAHRNYRKLADIHKDVHEAYRNVDRLQGKRIFATYFRVGFYGARFGDLDGDEFVYKDKPLAKLPEIAQRLESFYGSKFGKDNLVIIKDSKSVESSKLDRDKAYIQITYVEPYFDSYELRTRPTHFERNHGINRFIFATPFTADGSAHGELHEQFKRKTILVVSHHFPYVKTRIHVRERSELVLTPIEVAIEDVQKKIEELDSALKQQPADPKMLQMVLQGCIGTTVNQGPIEVANVFLKESQSKQLALSREQNKLRICFKNLSKKCEEALKRNKKLISSDQKEYQRELERNYERFVTHITPLTHQRVVARSLNTDTADVNHEDGKSNKVTSPMI